ncbi:MAG: DUF1002 domain-containing protein [Roseburia sp.]
MKRNKKKILSVLMAVSVLMTSSTVAWATETSSEETATDATSNAEASSSDATTDVKGTVTSNTGSESSSEATSSESAESTGDEVVITEKDKPYLALGADLTDEQRNTVLGFMGIDPANLEQYDVVYVTNEEEHNYLDQYIDSSAIGTRSLSSVVIVKRESGSGLNISTNNINYCTVGMYKNALTTAGITDADIIVAGPTSISGTAALVGIFKAYKEITGEEIGEDVIDTALNELVITGKLEDSIEGLTDEEVEEFIAYVKSLIAEKGLDDEESINEALDDACKKYDVTLTDEERQQIIDLLLKISSLDIDLSSLVDYASSLYNSFKGSGDASGIFESIGNFFSDLFSKIGDFFKGLFS